MRIKLGVFLYRYKYHLSLLGIVSLGLVLRLINLGSQSFWGDEALSFDTARHFDQVKDLIIYLSETDIHPPLYYILLRYWTDIFGVTEFSARLPSVIFGIGIILLGFWTAKRIFLSAKIGLLSAFILAILPMQVEFSQQARPYIIFCFFALLATYAIWEFWQTGQKKFLAGFVFSNILGLYLHYSYGFIFASLTVYWLAWILWKGIKFSDLFTWLVTNTIIVLLFFPWLEVFFYKIIFQSYSVFGLYDSLSARRAVTFFEETVGRLIWIGGSSAVDQSIVFVKLISLLVIGYAVVVGLRRSDLSRQALGYLGMLFLLTIIFYLIAPFSTPYSFAYERHVIFATVPASMIIAYFFSQFGIRRMMAITAIFSITLVPFLQATASNADNWSYFYNLRSVAEYVSDNYESGDLVLVAESFTRTDFNHYLDHQISAESIYPLNYFGFDYWRSRETLGLIEHTTHSRMPNHPPSEASVATKLDRLLQIHQPRRVWVYGLLDQDYSVRLWFKNHKARHAFQSMGELFPLDLYVFSDKY